MAAKAPQIPETTVAVLNHRLHAWLSVGQEIAEDLEQEVKKVDRKRLPSNMSAADREAYKAWVESMKGLVDMIEEIGFENVRSAA